MRLVAASYGAAGPPRPTGGEGKAFRLKAGLGTLGEEDRLMRLVAASQGGPGRAALPVRSIDAACGR